MRIEWLNLFGRIGSVSLAIGLALVTIAMIPPGSHHSSGYGTSLRSGRYLIEENGVFSQWKALRVSIDSSVDLRVFIFDVDRLELEDWVDSWVREHFPSLPEDEIRGASRNNSVLESVAQENSEHVLLERVMATGESAEIFPTEIINITTVVANYSPEQVYVFVESEDLNIFVPKEHIVIPAEAFAISGVVLTIPWTLQKRRRKSFSV